MSTQQILNVLTAEQLQTLLALPAVTAARQQVASGQKLVYFTVNLTADMKATLKERLGLALDSVSQIPMRWIQGDTFPHIDRGAADFSNTYLVYLTGSAGELTIGEETYPIEQNTGFVFSEGLNHKTLNTGDEPRLLLGPMSESGFAVGAPMFYYATEADAVATINSIAYGITYTVGDVFSGSIGSFTSWRLASSSSGSSSQSLVYPNGALLNSGGTYNLYPAAPCFLEGSKILCQEDGKEVWKPVEELRKGMLVKTSRDGYKRVELIGRGPYSNPGTDERSENRLYVCSPSEYPELTEDLVITGCHSILVDKITDVQRENTIKQLSRIFVTDKKYRLMACLDERAKPWLNEGTHTIWHFALESEDDGINFGVYANGGLLVETCSLRFLRTKGNLVLQA
jgi:hypothetical protein